MDLSLPTDDQIRQLFDTPGEVAAGTFELALVLGGTVSAGAYTAGVMDFLIEALDAWTGARDGGGPVPNHRTMMRFLCGTSGGGVCAAVAMRALNFDFPPVTQGTDLAVAAGNPFYDTWVNGLDIAPMLVNDDLPTGATLVSLLNGRPIAAVADKAANFVGATRAAPRAWVTAPLRTFLTLTNLNGIPYTVLYGAMTMPDGSTTDLSQQYTAHADFARFAVVYSGRSLALADVRPDEFVLCYDGTRYPAPLNWSGMGMFALSTAAFPIGLPSRTCPRPLLHYKYRLFKGLLKPVPVDWGRIQDAYEGIPDVVNQTYVDGGVCNNEPVELARTALAGVSVPNPRDGMAANRAVVLIDPFAGQGSMTGSVPSDVLSTVMALVPGMLQEMRFDAQDVLLAADPDIYSRFMIAASNGTDVGNFALATAGLGAFLGFACKAFRRHDYMLGRKNCQDYLRSMLVLPRGNVLFDGWRDGAFAAEYLVKDSLGAEFLPIIPLVESMRVAERVDPWPAGALQSEQLRPLLEQRFTRLLSAEFAKGPLSGLLTWLVGRLSEGAAADFAVKAIDAALTQWGLQVPGVPNVLRNA